ncbi:YciI family protein [Pseudoduganella chitinolytica]|uniref:YCII-related domain-containing protein n=1 Tax=Pseudoduganella chitinolytica TaxID=34070 RepID=A0ABY8B6I0_9BURK|nr:YciI family protein [Pseudoduganella chitinolytica]WEF31546.1 hypothetical protein PX653_19065 [Pseudoduganella chitinolytica]
MFVVLLKFSDNKSRAADFMQGHNEWIKRGIDDGKFLLVGSIQPAQGGAIIALDSSLEALQERVNADPFVVENVVKAEIIAITPGKVDPRLAVLAG